MALLKPAQAAEYVGIPTSTVYYLARKNRLPCVMIGCRVFFRKEALDEWLERGGEACRFGRGGPNGTVRSTMSSPTNGGGRSGNGASGPDEPRGTTKPGAVSVTPRHPDGYRSGNYS